MTCGELTEIMHSMNIYDRAHETFMQQYRLEVQINTIKAGNVSHRYYPGALTNDERQMLFRQYDELRGKWLAFMEEQYGEDWPQGVWSLHWEQQGQALDKWLEAPGKRTMGNPEPIAALMAGEQAWTRWREANMYDGSPRYRMTPDLSGVDLTGVNIDGMLFAGCNFQNARLAGAIGRPNLAEVDLRGADLRGWSVQDAFFFKANLDGANMSEGDFSESDFDSASLVGANLSGAVLAGCDFSRADLRNANMENAGVHRIMFKDTKVEGALFGGTAIPSEELRWVIGTPITRRRKSTKSRWWRG